MHAVSLAVSIPKLAKRSLYLRYNMAKTGLRSRRILSDPGPGLKRSASTPTPTPLRLRPNKSYSFVKGAICFSHFIDFHFECIQKGDKAIQHQCALTADAVGRGYC